MYTLRLTALSPRSLIIMKLALTFLDVTEDPTSN